MKKRVIRLTTGLVVGIGMLILGVWILSKELAMPETLYEGRPGEYWAAQLNGADAAASKQANAILNAEIIPNLTKVMFFDTNDSALRVGLIKALNGLPGITIPFMPADDRRKSAAIELGKFGPAARAGVPALLRALNGNDDAVHECAAISLGIIHAEPDLVIPALTRWLDADGVKDRAATALGEFGPAAKAAVPKLVTLLQENDPETQFAASQALRAIDSEAYARAKSENQGATNNAGVKEAGTPDAK